MDLAYKRQWEWFAETPAAALRQLAALNFSIGFSEAAHPPPSLSDYPRNHPGLPRHLLLSDRLSSALHPSDARPTAVTLCASARFLAGARRQGERGAQPPRPRGSG